MKIPFLSKTNCGSINIEITDNKIKLLQLSKRKDKYKIEALAALQYDAASMNLTDKLKELLQTAQPQSKNVAIAISAKNTIDKTIQLNFPIAETELEDFIKLNAEKYLGKSAAQLYFDYQLIEQTAQNNGKKIRIIAAEQSLIDPLINNFSQAGLCLTKVDVSTFCAMRAHRVLQQTRDNAALINIDSDDALLVCVDKPNSAHCEIVSVDTDLVTKISAFSNQHTINCLTISGDLATVNLAQTITAVSALPCEIAQPFVNMEIANHIDCNVIRNLAPCMLICYGLAYL